MNQSTLAKLSGSTAPARRAGRRVRHRRGVAMLLVLLALGVGTVLAAAALSSRDNSAAIGQNAQRSAAARWAAEGGLRVALAVLETTFDWSTVTDGKVLDQFVIAGASVTVTATTPAGDVPTDDDREMILTAVAEYDGLTTTLKERVSLVTAQPIEKSINPYLDEFAVFAANSMRIEDGAKLTPWEASPEHGTLIPLRLGTGFGAASQLSVGGSAQAGNAVLFSDASASGSLADSTDESALAGVELFPIDVPTMGEILPTSLETLGTGGSSLTVTNAQTLSSSASHGAATVRGNGVLTLDGSSKAVFSFNSLNIRNRGTLRIQGDVRIHVAGALTVQNRGCVELADANSSVTFYTGGDVTVRNAGLGVSRDVARSAQRAPSSVSTYVSPTKVRLIALNTAAGGKASPVYTIDRNSLVFGAIHAPQATVTIGGNADLIGRVSAASFTLRSGSELVYDPTLDPRSGFSAKIGPLYERDGTPCPDVLAAVAQCDPDLGSAWWSMTAINAVTNQVILNPDDDLQAVTETTPVLKQIVDGVIMAVDGTVLGYTSGSGTLGSGTSGSGSSGKGKGYGSGKKSGSSGYSSGSGTSGSTSAVTASTVPLSKPQLVVEDGVAVRYTRKVVHAPICPPVTGAQQ